MAVCLRRVYLLQKIISSIPNIGITMANMQNTKLRKKIVLLGLVCALSTTLTGCDQIKSKLSSLTSDPSPAEMAVKIDKMVKDGDHLKAIKQGEAYLDKNQDSSGVVSEAIVDAYMVSGDASGVVRHLQKYKTGSNQSSEVSSESSSVQATQTIQPSQSSQSSQSSSSSAVAADGASVVNTKRGTVVRAGDAVVISPK